MSDPLCPYCSFLLKKRPKRKTKCPNCSCYIYVKWESRGDERTLITQKERDEIEELRMREYEKARVSQKELMIKNIQEYQESLVGVLGVVGTRFILSENHHHEDGCQRHAEADLHGLGKGVYPLGKSPLPVEGCTLNYEVAVFDDEIEKPKKKTINWNHC